MATATTIDEIRRNTDDPYKARAYPNQHRVGTTILNTVDKIPNLPDILIQSYCDMYECVGEVEHGGSCTVFDYEGLFGVKYLELKERDEDNDELKQELYRLSMMSFAAVVVDMILSTSLMAHERL